MWPNDGGKDLYLGGGRHITPAPAIAVLRSWPTRVAVTPGSVCGRLRAGQGLARTPKSNPVREAFRLFFHGREGVGRNAWDLCAVLYAVRGTDDPWDGPMFAEDGSRHLHLEPSGAHGWLRPGNGRHVRVYRVKYPRLKYFCDERRGDDPQARAPRHPPPALAHPPLGARDKATCRALFRV